MTQARAQPVPAARWNPAPWRPYDLGVILALVAMLVHGIVDVPFFKNELSLEFGALLGILWAADRWTRAGNALYGRGGP